MVLTYLVLLVAHATGPAPFLPEKAPLPAVIHQEQTASRDSTVIDGTVVDAASGESLIGAHIYLIGRGQGTVSDAKGAFLLENLPPGVYTLEARMIGFEPVRKTVTLAEPGARVSVHFGLNEETVSLSEIVVTPGRFAIQQLEAHTPNTFSQEDINNVPQFGEDIYRAVTRLPGMAANDFSSKFMLRGGEHDEVLVTFDGLELYDPFHLKDVGGGGLSIIDAGIIGGVDLLTGAFPASYGNRLSGVFDIESSSPPREDARSSLGISFINSRALSKGTLKNENTSWMVVGRRGYLDLLLGLVDDSFSFVPQYYDAFGKLEHRFGEKHRLAVQWLLSGDRLAYRDVLDPNDYANTRYGNAYAWANWKAVWTPRLYSQTLISQGIIWQNREGAIVRSDGLLRFRTADDRSFEVTNLKQDWTFDLSPSYLISWGVDLKAFSSSYDYVNTRMVQDMPNPDRPQDVVTWYEDTIWQGTPGGIMTGIYTSHRFRLGSRVTTEMGGRFGSASWTGDRFFDPRLNVAYQMSKNTILRSGWGFFHQVHGIEQLDVPDGGFDFYGAQRAEHIVVGLEQLITKDLSLRLDLYNKRISNVRPRYISLLGDVTRFFPEIDPDRTLYQPDRGRMRGLEVLLQKENGRLFNWWASYTLSRTEERVDGVYRPKDFDQLHAVYLDASVRPAPRLQVNVAWQYHTGWRYTAADIEVLWVDHDDILYSTEYGPYNADQFPAYHRMDVRISYDFDLKQHGLATYLEVRNVYNRQNVRTYKYKPEVGSNRTITFRPEPEHWLPILPAIGIRLDLKH